MCSRFREAVCAALMLPALALAQTPALRICAEPDNLPYSNRDRAGFENAIAEVVAAEMGRSVSYTWLANRRGFVRKTLNARECDVIVGVPKDFEPVRTTAPYYASTYVFVFRASDGARVRSFLDPAIRSVRIGVPLVADDMATTPPGHALARVGAVDNVVGYPVDGDGPQGERIVRAVASGELDVGVVWGPQAGYFARKQTVPLETAVAEAPPALARVPFAYSIAMGVRKDDAALADALDVALARRRADIDAILERFAIPRSDRHHRAAATP
jgi:mxaJ protein